MSVPSDATLSNHSLFIAFEGVDGSGKTTQAQLLADWYQKHGVAVTLTREPGGTELGERLRAIVLDPTIACTPRAELLTLLAARAQHVAEVIAPALAAGQVVIVARFTLSTLVYQGYVRGLPVDEIQAANAVAVEGMHPDLTILVDVPFETIHTRISERNARIGERQDRFEGEGASLLRRVIDGYRYFAAADPTVRIIDGTGTIEQVQDTIRREVLSVQASRIK